eukprot:16407884-Heterocapsa_arctica.AAC.1
MWGVSCSGPQVVSRRNATSEHASITALGHLGAPGMRKNGPMWEIAVARAHGLVGKKTDLARQ